MTGTPAPQATPKSVVLAVLLHSWRHGRASMAGVEDAVREAYASADTEVIVLRPQLPHADWWRCERAANVVREIVRQIDQEVDHRKPDRIVLVGNSIGAALARRAFLVAAGCPKNFHPEPELDGVRPYAWASKVERIVLIAAFNRGWKISDGLSWRYWLWFNVVGFFGHIVPALRPTIFDFRLGAPFIAQTRLHWLAHRRHGRTDGEADTDAVAAHQPILIQMIGTQDDLIRPFDQIDISVDGTKHAFAANRLDPDKAAQPPKAEAQDYFLLEMPYTDHNHAAVMSGDAQAQERRRLFKAALTESRENLAPMALDPALLADEVDPVDETVEDTVFVIHGIRDDGFWTHRIAERIRRAGQDDTRGRQTVFRSWTPSYGYFAMLPFMLYWVRREKVEWFADQYVTAFAQYPTSNFHYVGHSNGTYLLARALKDYRAMHFRNVLFAGSVVRGDYPWKKMIERKRVERFQNVVASADMVVAWLPKSVEWCRLFDLGGGGFDGFRDAGRHERIHEFKYVRGGHSAGIAEDFWGQIATFVTQGRPIERLEPPSGRDVYEDEANPTVEVIAGLKIGIPAVILIGLSVLAAFTLIGSHHGGTAGGWLGALLAILLIRFVVTRV